jgi:hypothetical protein
MFPDTCWSGHFFLFWYVEPVLRLFFLVGWDWVSWYCGHYWPIVPAPDDSWWWLWRNWWNEDWQGKPKYSEKTCPSVTLSTTNPTWLDPGLNLGRRVGKPATNRLSCGAALSSPFSYTLYLQLAFIVRGVFFVRNWGCTILLWKGTT